MTMILPLWRFGWAGGPVYDMHVCVYIYVYMYTYNIIYIYIYIYVYVYIYTHYSYMYIHIYIHIRTDFRYVCLPCIASLIVKSGKISVGLHIGLKPNMYCIRLIEQNLDRILWWIVAMLGPGHDDYSSRYYYCYYYDAIIISYY